MDRSIRLPTGYQTFSEARREGFVKVMEAKERGQKFAGYFCTYTPIEIFRAAGFLELSLCGMSEETIPAAERDLPVNLCPLIKSSYGFALTDKCPFTYFSDVIITETTCDGKKKMYEYLSRIKKTYNLQLPQVQDESRSLPMLVNEFRLLADYFEQEFGVQITEEKLRRAIHDVNRERAQMLTFLRLGQLVPPVISGWDLFDITDGFSFVFDKEEQFQLMDDLIQTLQRKYACGEYAAPSTAKRIMITGSPMGGVKDKVIPAIESCGGVVVCFENCSGEREKLRLVDESPDKDPYVALAEKYLSISCSVMTPNLGRLEAIQSMIERYHIDGVVEVVLHACHTYTVEAMSIREKVTSLGVPYLYVESDYSQNDIGQLKTRIEAFLEII